MSENPQPSELVVVSPPDIVADNRPGSEVVQAPDKILRIGSMVRQLLEEVRQAPLDEASRHRLREIYETAVREIADALSPEMRNELARLAPPFDETSTPSDAELRIAHAQLVGWLEGLFQGIQATLFTQQMAARAQMEEMRRTSGAQQSRQGDVHGTYL